MRYLCYDNDYNGKSFDISLRYPEYLVSLSTYKFKISNISQCVNLRNLHSYLNIYNSDDIVSLKSLGRVYSWKDKYDKNGNCLLQELFKNNKLEYVLVYNEASDSNTVNSFVINDNIENLRFMCVYYDKGDYDIKLNISQTAPENLRVFGVETKKYNVHKYGTIEGNEDKVNEIKQKLIHELKENK